MNQLKCRRFSFFSAQGNVESAITIVPLLLLFLIGMQLATTSIFRNNARVSAQTEATKRAIYGSFKSTDEFVHIDSSGSDQNLDLLLVQNEMSIPQLINSSAYLSFSYLPSHVSINGFAVIENRR